MDSRFAKANRCVIAAAAFLVVLAIFPFTPDPAGDIKILGYELFAFVALALWLFTPRYAKVERQLSSALLPLFIAFLGFNLVAAFYSVNMGYSLCREFIKTGSLFILFLAAADAYHTPKQVWALVSVICVAVSIAALYGIAQHMGLDPFPWNNTSGMLRDAPATFGNPNLASHTIMPTIILAGGLCTLRKGRWAFLCIPLLLSLFAFTRSRGSLLALAGALVLVIVAQLISRRVKKQPRAIVLTLGALLGAATIVISMAATITNLYTGQPYPDGTSVTLRYNSVYGASRMIQDSPWLGHGPGMYPVANPEYWTLLEKERFATLNMRNVYVHNEPLEIAVEAGLPAAIVYIAILVLGLYYGLSLRFGSRDSDRRSLGMTSAAFFFAFLLDGLFGFNLNAPASAVLLFLIAGTTAGVWRASRAPMSRRPFRYGLDPILRRLLVLSCAAIIPILGIRDFSAQFFHQRGLGALEFEAYAEATESFAKASSLAPYNWLHPYLLGMIDQRMGRPDEGVKHFGRTLELHPNFLHARINKARTLLNMVSSSSKEEAPAILQQAVSDAERAVRIAPQLPEPHDILGRAAILRAQWQSASRPDEILDRKNEAWQEAEDHLLEAIENGHKDKGTLYRLIALSRLAGENVLGAQNALVRSLEIEPEALETWGLLLQSSGTSGEYDTIKNSLDWCIERLSNSRSAPDALGALKLLRTEILYKGYGRRLDAENAFLQSVLDYPMRIDAWATFHEFAKTEGRNEAFNAILLRTIAGQEKAEENLPDFLQSLSVGLAESENGIVEGVSRLANALQLHQDTATDPERTVSNYSWAADLLAARAQQTTIPPRDAGVVYLQLGLMYELFQDFDTAAQMLDQASPNLSGAQLLLCLHTRGAALTEMDDTSAAVRVFEKVVAIAPYSFEGHLALAGALVRDEQWLTARLKYESILASFAIDDIGIRTIQEAIDGLPK